LIDVAMASGRNVLQKDDEKKRKCKNINVEIQ
jgi:hypothetical protein